MIDDTCVYTNSFEDALSPSICRPKGIAVDTAGNVYFSDTRSVRKIKFVDADVTIADATVQSSTARHVTDTYSFTAVLLGTLLLTLYFHLRT